MDVHILPGSRGGSVASFGACALRTANAWWWSFARHAHLCVSWLHSGIISGNCACDHLVWVSANVTRSLHTISYVSSWFANSVALLVHTGHRTAKQVEVHLSSSSSYRFPTVMNPHHPKPPPGSTYQCGTMCKNPMAITSAKLLQSDCRNFVLLGFNVTL